MTITEKLIVLRNIDVFSYISNELLLLIANFMEEAQINANEQIIKKGDIDGTMYIIVNGKVKVHDGEHVLATLGNNEIFGELSALSPDKRSASVTALENCLLLKIDDGKLYHLMEVHNGLAKGFIQMLCNRIRKINANLIQKNIEKNI